MNTDHQPPVMPSPSAHERPRLGGMVINTPIFKPPQAPVDDTETPQVQENLQRGFMKRQMYDPEFELPFDQQPNTQHDTTQSKRMRLENVSRHQTHLFELCCSMDSNLTNLVNTSGGKAVRMTLENGYDWTKKETLERAKRQYDQLRPKMVWGSPTCGPFSAAQNMNQNTPEQCEELHQKRIYSASMIENIIEFLNYAAAHGAITVFEHPLTATSWQMIPALFKYRVFKLSLIHI